MSLATSLYDALTAINIPKNQARQVVEALEHKMTTEFTTKSDVALLRADIAVVVARLERYEEMTKTEFAAVRGESRSLEYRLVVKLGGLMVTLFGVFTAVIALLR